MYKLVSSFLTETGRKAVSNLSWLTVALFLSQCCGLLTVLVLTKGLSRQDYGVLSVSLSLQMYLQLVSTAGLPSVIVRESAAKPTQEDTIITAYFLVCVGLSMGIFFSVWLILRFVPITTIEKQLFLLVAVGNVFTSFNVRPLFDLKHRQSLSGFISFAGELLTVLLFLGAWSVELLTLQVAGILFVLKWAVIALAHFVVYTNRISSMRLVFSNAVLLDLLRSSWPLLVAGLAATVPLTSGIFFVRYYCGKSDAGLLGVAVQVTNAYYMFCSLSNRVVFPHIVGPYGFHWTFLKKLVLFCALFFTSLAVVFAVGGYVAIQFILDVQYLPAISSMLLLILGRWITCFAFVAGLYLIANKNETTYLITTVMTALLFLCCCFFLVPTYSHIGVAASACFAATFQLGVVMFFCWKLLHFVER